MTRDPVPVLLRTGVYILLCYATPVFILGWLFIWVFGLLAGSVLAMFLFALLGNFLCFRIFEGVGLEELSMLVNTTGGRNTLTGLMLGLAAALFVILIPLVTGAAHEIPVSDPTVNWREQMFVPFMVFVGAAAEEILFRGYAFQLLLRAFGPFATILPVGVLFGLAHGNNPHASVIGLVNTMGFGIIFGYAFWRSHDIWFPLGLHYGWNLTLLLFGADISGITMRVTRYRMVWNTPVLWSGGDYGPEGSLLTSIVIVLLAAAVYFTGVVRQYSYVLDGAREE